MNSVLKQLRNLGRDGLRPVRGRDGARPSRVGTEVLQLPLLYEKSKEFASRVVKMHVFLRKKHEDVMSKQVLRSGTSIGANLAEAQYAASRADFAAKVAISLKECNETIFWLDLLADNGYISKSMYESISCDCRELLAMLVSTVKTLKKA